MKIQIRCSSPNGIKIIKTPNGIQKRSESMSGKLVVVVDFSKNKIGS